MGKPIFIDRDGVLNVDISPYVSRLEQLQIFPFVSEALRKLHENGYEIFVISNQQGVALGITSAEELDRMTAALQETVKPFGFSIKAFYHCIALDTENHPWRKPSPGMILAAQKDHGLDLKDSFFIGDKWSDVECAVRAGCRPLLVLTGVTGPEGWKNWKHQPERVFPSLKEAVDWITSA